MNPQRCPKCHQFNVISGTEDNGRSMRYVCVTDGCNWDYFIEDYAVSLQLLNRSRLD